jgi:hypothetical protein
MCYNHTPVQSLANYAPITIFSGLAACRPVQGFFDSGKNWTNLKVDIADLMDKLRAEIHDRTITVSEVQEQSFYQREVRRRRKRHVRKTNFMVGDFVMVMGSQRTKLSQRWTGPARVVALSSDGNRVSVEFLAENADKRPKEYHCSHVQFFDYAVMQVSSDIKQQADYYASHKYEVAGLVDMRKIGRDIQVQVEWDTGDLTWEPLVTIFTDIPQMTADFLYAMARDKPELAGQAQSIIRTLNRKKPRRDES